MTKRSSHLSPFALRVYDVVRTIPKGSTRSYQDIAQMAGHPRAYRAVATLMAQNRDPGIPCHRVIRSDGSPGDYNRGGPSEKLRILRAEGVTAL